MKNNKLSNAISAISIIAMLFSVVHFVDQQNYLPVSKQNSTCTIAAAPPGFAKNKVEEKEEEIKEPECPMYINTLSEDLQDYIYNTCKEYAIEDYYCLVLAIIIEESSCDPLAISATNDYGLMQINICNHATLRELLGIDNFLDPEQNVAAGIYMISNYLLKYETEDMALMAYNMGPGGAADNWNNGIYTSSYSRNIMETYIYLSTY